MLQLIGIHGRYEYVSGKRLLRAGLAASVLLGLLGVPAPAWATAPDADFVFGQQGDFTRYDWNSGTHADTFEYPMQSAMDVAHQRMFIADAGFNRVLEYDLDTDGKPLDDDADHVLGHTDFTSGNASLSSTMMDNPTSLAYDPTTQRLFVNDSGNFRILVFDVTSITDGEPAVHVLGQPDFTTSSPGTTASTLNATFGLGIDVGGQRLFSADAGNNRVLVYDISTIVDGEPAVHELGQADFTSAVPATSQTGLNTPAYATFEPVAERLYVSDVNRILVFDISTIIDGEAAINVLGQTDFTSNGPTTTQTGLSSPDAAVVDPVGHRLFVCDYGNSRVLVYDLTSLSDGMAATAVFGKDDFTSGGTYETGRNRLFEPEGISFEPSTGVLAVSDSQNNRVFLYYLPPASPGGATAQLTVTVDPTLTFTVGSHTGACNGASQSAGSSSNANAIALGRVNASANALGAQDLRVTTNAATGFTVFLRNTAQMNDGNGHTIADVSGGNATPGSFPAPGTAGFGYTTNEANLGSGTADRFTNIGPKWAKLTGTNAEVSYAASGPATNDTACVAYQLAVAPNTPAGTYSTTVVYTAVPKY